MLIDAKLISDPVTRMIAELNGNSAEPKKLETGVYLLGHFSLDNMITPRLEFEQRYPALDDIGSYGVCDDYKQVIDKCPMLITSERKFVMSVTPIKKSTQSPTGGWRWHKWGDYIGTQKRSGCEYIYDEPEIELVYCYNIVEII